MAFRGFGRCKTNHDGSFKIVTLKPGPLPFGDGRTEAPHIDVSVFSRGMLDRSVTRIYFPDEDAANAADPVLEVVPADRRGTLIAAAGGDGLLRFDIYMQGPARRSSSTCNRQPSCPALHPHPTTGRMRITLPQLPDEGNPCPR